MPDLIVRNVEESIVRALQERAARHGRSAEAEHRILLAEALLKPRRHSFAEVLAEMPGVRLDHDFEPSAASAAEVRQGASPTLKALLLSDEARAEIPVPPRRVGSRRVPPGFE